MSCRCSNLEHFVTYTSIFFLENCWERKRKEELRFRSPRHPWTSEKKRSMDGASRRLGKFDGLAELAQLLFEYRKQFCRYCVCGWHAKQCLLVFAKLADFVLASRGTMLFCPLTPPDTTLIFSTLICVLMIYHGDCAPDLDTCNNCSRSTKGKWIYQQAHKQGKGHAPEHLDSRLVASCIHDPGRSVYRLSVQQYLFHVSCFRTMI